MRGTPHGDPGTNSVILEIIIPSTAGSDMEQREVWCSEWSRRSVSGGLAQAEGAWSDGPEEGGIARSYAARFCSELAGDGGMHQALSDSGLADALAERSCELVSEQSKQS